MTAGPSSPAGHRQRRARLFLPLLRSGAVVVVATVLYYVLPLDRDPAVGTTAVTLILGLLAFGALITWQTMTIAGSAHPRLRAVEALTTAVPLFLLLFSAAYFLYAKDDGRAFSQPLNRTDALYFTVTVFATVGFGDIVPVTQAARVMTVLQMVADLILVGLIAKAMFGAVQIGLERRRSASRPDERDP